MTLEPIISACPSCGLTAERDPYDIGSGPELSCAGCEWCWGAEGQPLKPYVPPLPFDPLGPNAGPGTEDVFPLIAPPFL